MGVYIKGMEIPRSCYDCPLQDDECFGSIKCCYAKTWGSANMRAVDCPLIPVPDHGKLIDADKLIARLERQRTVILHNLPEVHAMEEGYTKEDYIFERNGDMVSILRNQAGVIPSDMEDSKE